MAEYEQSAFEVGDEDRAELVRSVRAGKQWGLKHLYGRTEWLEGSDEKSITDQAGRIGAFSAVGMFGGLMLLVPMTIMVLIPGVLTSLLTTTLFVYLITLILAIVLSYGRKGHRAQVKDMFGAVAAYTAVLVVFVGTNAQEAEKIDRKTRIAGALVLTIPGLLAIFFLGSGLYAFNLSRNIKRRRLQQAPAVSGWRL